MIFSYVDPSAPLSFQQVRTRIVMYLLRHQLLMQAGIDDEIKTLMLLALAT